MSGASDYEDPPAVDLGDFGPGRDLDDVLDEQSPPAEVPPTVAAHLAELLDHVLRRSEDIPANDASPSAVRVRQAVADLNAAAIDRLFAPRINALYVAIDEGSDTVPALLEALEKDLGDQHPACVRARAMLVFLSPEPTRTVREVATEALPDPPDDPTSRCIAALDLLLSTDLTGDTSRSADLIRTEQAWLRSRPMRPATVEESAASAMQDPRVALAVWKALSTGRIRLASPWSGDTRRMLRTDVVTGTTIAEVHRTGFGIGGQPDTYGVRVLGQEGPGGTLAEAKAYGERMMAARDVRAV